MMESVICWNFIVNYKMKILHYLPYSYHIHTWGLEKIAQTIADWLDEQQKCESLIVASDIRRWSWKSLSEYKDTFFIPSFDLVHNFPVPKIWKKDFWRQFTIIKNHKPEVIITHTRFFIQSFLGGIIAKWLWVTWVHVEHGSGFVTGYPWYIKICAWLFDWTFGLWIFRQCDQIVTISQMHQIFIKKFTNKNPVVIYNPINYIPREKTKNDMPHIGFIASLLPRKWCDLLIEALSKIQDKQWICTIVGDGSERKKLEDLTESLWLIERITFIWADDRSNRLHTFDIFVNPSHQEWLPTTVVEALFAKCVVVATDVGGTKEISDQDDLILVQPEILSIQKWLEQALLSLLKSGKSYKIVQERFWSEESLSKYFHVISS